MGGLVWETAAAFCEASHRFAASRAINVISSSETGNDDSWVMIDLESNVPARRLASLKLTLGLAFALVAHRKFAARFFALAEANDVSTLAATTVLSDACDAFATTGGKVQASSRPLSEPDAVNKIG
jgi:hypothetical protein